MTSSVTSKTNIITLATVLSLCFDVSPPPRHLSIVMNEVYNYVVKNMIWLIPMDTWKENLKILNLMQLALWCKSLLSRGLALRHTSSQFSYAAVKHNASLCVCERSLATDYPPSFPWSQRSALIHSMVRSVWTTLGLHRDRRYVCKRWCGCNEPALPQVFSPITL